MTVAKSAQKPPRFVVKPVGRSESAWQIQEFVMRAKA